MKIKHRQLSLFVSLWLVFAGICFAFSEQELIEKYTVEARMHSEKEEYEKAVESYRKVLFINSSNANAVFELASVYEKLNMSKQAKNEYAFFLKIVENDDSTSAAEKELNKKIARDWLQNWESKQEKKFFKYDGAVPFFNLVVVLSVFLFVFILLVRMFYLSVKKALAVKESKEQFRLWLDPYWQRQKEKEVGFKRVDPVRMILIVYVAVSILYMTHSFRVYGLRAFLSSFKELFFFWL